MIRNIKILTIKTSALNWSFRQLFHGIKKLNLYRILQNGEINSE
jgi:hypothetical protein